MTDRKTNSLYKLSHLVTNGLLQAFKEKLKCLKNHFLHKEGWKILDFWIIFSKVLFYYNHIWTTCSLLNIYASFWQPTKMCRHYLLILNYIGKNDGELNRIKAVYSFHTPSLKSKNWIMSILRRLLGFWCANSSTSHIFFRLKVKTEI